MKITNKITEMKDRKAWLSLLWIFVMFNFTYADILTLYFNNVLQKQAWQLFQSGYVGSGMPGRGVGLKKVERSRVVSQIRSNNM